MPIAVGDRFVRRQNAARASASNLTAADIGYDTAVISEGGYGAWGAGETDTTRVDTAGKYLWIADYGRVADLLSNRGVGTIVPVVDGVTQEPVGLATHRYLRGAGGANEGASIGFGILDVAIDSDIGAHKPGAILSVDAAGSFATDATAGGALQLMRLPDGDFLHLERSTDQAITSSVINTTRPWVDSSGTWTKLTWPTEVSDDGAWHAASSGDVILPAGTKFLIVWNTSIYSSGNQRKCFVTRLSINGTIHQSGSGYQRLTSSQGPPATGMFLYETGGGAETLFLEATEEEETSTTETPQFADGALQVIALPPSTEWVHVDNGATDSLTTALAGLLLWDETPLSSTFRADGGSNLSLDAANNAVQNDSGGTLAVLALGWHRWDRDATNTTRKVPWVRWNNNGTVLDYGIGGAYSRGAQGTADTWQAHYCSAAMLDMAAAADLTLEVNDPAGAANSDMGVYASTNRHFLGMQVLDVSSLVGAQIITIGAATETETPQTITPVKPIIELVGAATETEPASVINPTKNITVTASTESETAAVIAVSKPIITAIAAVTETEVAQVINAFLPFTSCGLPFTLPRVLPTCELVGPITVVIGAATETEVVAAVQAGKAVTITAATETEVAELIGAAKLATAGAAIETETAQVITPAKPIVTPVTPATETELVHPVDAVKVITVTVGAVSETEAVQQIAATKTSTIGAPSEIEAAQPVIPLKPITVAVGASTETETAQVVNPVIARVVAIGVVTETEAAQPVAAIKPIIVSVTAVTETETAVAIPATKQHTISAVTETEAAQLISAAKTVSITPATETETAELIGAVKDITVAIGAATETELAQPITALIANMIAVGAATETEAAQIVTVLKPIIATVSAATETELAYVITVVTAAGVLKFVVASVAHPSATISVTYPTGAGAVSHPTGAVIVSHPDADADVSSPAAVGTID